MKNNYCVIMAGGVGSRFWPMSRTAHPKQFMDILGTGETLLQQTYNRFLKLCPKENIYIVTNESYVGLVNEQIKGIDSKNILSEPARKNTAPCVAYACYKIAQLNPDALTVIAPSDHLITKEDTFVKAIKACYAKAAAEDCLVTLGINPSRPDTGYGYIQFVESEIKEKDSRIKRVKTFTEKTRFRNGQILFTKWRFLMEFRDFYLECEECYQSIRKTLFRHGCYFQRRE
jgi:mannose-1-phosphate guanylyltransferase